MPASKGSFFVAMKKFVLERFGPEQWARLMGTLSSEDRAQIEAATSITWVDVDVRLRSLHAMREVLGSRDASLLTTFGRFEAENDLSTTQRLFLRLANPGYAMEKAGQYWRRFHDWGGLEVDRLSKHEARATVVDSAVANELWCIQFQAYMGRVFELVGARDVKMEHVKCCARGDSTCVFEGSWR
jgi:hypothetical protein